MRKLILFNLIFVAFCFALPIIFTKRHVTAETVSKQEDENKTFNYKQYSKVKLLHNETGQIEKLDLDEYLYGVVAAEMPASYEEEALKAQAVVARTYTIYKMINGSKHEGADICDAANCCQAWISKEARFLKWSEEERESNWEKILTAVNTTKGEIITYDNEPINAFFHSNSGGITEVPVNIWGGQGYPYLQSVETSGEDAYTQYLSENIFTKDELLNKLKEKYNDIVINFDNAEDIKILEFTDKVPELMSISDLVITKPGGLTTSESLASSLPIVVINPIPGQEEENAEFLEKFGCAVWIKKDSNPEEILNSVLNNDKKLNEMKQNSIKLSKKDSTSSICRICIDGKEN